MTAATQQKPETGQQKDWQGVLSAYNGWQYFEAAERGYEAQEADEARNFYYKKKSAYEMKYKEIWDKADCAAPSVQDHKDAPKPMTIAPNDGLKPTNSPVVHLQQLGRATRGKAAAVSVNYTATAGHNNPPTDEEIYRAKVKERHPDIFNQATELARTRFAPKEIDEKVAGELTTHIGKVDKCLKSLEKLRKEEKDPSLKEGQVIDGYFKKVKSVLDANIQQAQTFLKPYLMEKEHLERVRAAEAAEQLRKEAEAQRKAEEALHSAALPIEAGEARRAAEKIDTHAARIEKLVESSIPMARVQSSEFSSIAALKSKWAGEVINIKKLDIVALKPYFSADAVQAALDRFVRDGGRELVGAKIYETTDVKVRG